MLEREYEVLLSSYRRLLRHKATSAIKKMLKKTRPIDLAMILRSFTNFERKELFNLIENVQYKAELIAELDVDIFHELIDTYETNKIKEIVVELPGDDQADVLDKLPDKIEQEVIELMNARESSEIDELLKYPPDSAGGIMVTLPLKMNEETSVQEAIEIVQTQEEIETVYYLYIVNQADRLTGVLSLRTLLSARPEFRLKNIMQKDLISVKPDTDQEIVARLVSRYDLIAIPVVDDKNHILGIITVDDIIDVIREEATEDMFKMVGVYEGESVNNPLLKSVRSRLPWLFVNLGTAFLAAFTVGLFEDVIAQVVALAAAMPIVAGMGGNAGTQTLSVVIRGIALGEIKRTKGWKIAIKEASLGIINGVALGLITGIILFIFYGNPYLGIIIFLSMILNLFMACLSGYIVPMGLKLLGIDPALASAIFITTITDVFGFFAFLGLARIFLDFLK